ncbi:MAG: TAXI family TRAP transporter solute-binding subunit [Pseudomonadota bacterium]|jgi:TRAP transporter TAXI family solute receptor|nr:TAXI family TRAP transporter solute-binding subunit [Pseudomonadota bacterium]MEC7701517.1 TAXI family TRAP transporter solute-binding subunit [Pseudomonadota bacterium]MEE3323355.1 TAXI family TRAP transporter solute-binding subunit [Pseudomonadota bacterium]
MHIPETVKTYGLIALIIACSFWFAARFIEPTPPKEITIAAGAVGGDYYRYAEKYQKHLANEGITLNILETAGSLENITLLEEKKADIAFIQSGLATEDNSEYIEALSGLYFEPIWVFMRTDVFSGIDLQKLKNRRIAIGKVGSGTNKVARQLLELNKMVDDTTLLEISGQDAIDALKKGTVDAAVFVAKPSAATIQTLMHDKSLHLLSFDRAYGYTSTYKFLSKVTLNEGVIDMAQNIPNKSVPLLSPVAQLAAHKDFHGALKTLLVSVTMDIHKDATLLSTKGQFPTLDFIDLPIASEATRYFTYGPNILQRFLPFWLVDMISRMVVMLIPLLGVMLPLIKLASPTYRWRTRSKIYKWYKSLKKMEETANASDADLDEILAALSKIDADVKKTIVPLSYADELYNLRLHIQMIKDHVERNKHP